MRAKMAYLLFPSSCYFLLPLPLSSCCFPPLFSFFLCCLLSLPLSFLFALLSSLSLLFIWQMLHGNSWTRDVWDRWSGCAKCQPPEEPRSKRTNPQQRMFICQKGMCAGVDRGLVGDLDFAVKNSKDFPLHKPRKHKKSSHRMFRHMHGVLNEVYLQNFLHRWVVNRETNLMSLLNPWFCNSNATVTIR